MLMTFEAEVDEEGKIQPKEPVALAPGTRLLVTVLGEPEEADVAVWSEGALAVDWLRLEEDEARTFLEHE